LVLDALPNRVAFEEFVLRDSLPPFAVNRREAAIARAKRRTARDQ